MSLLTGTFEDFTIEFLHRIFEMINILSPDITDTLPTYTDASVIDHSITSKRVAILLNIVQQCSEKIL